MSSITADVRFDELSPGIKDPGCDRSRLAKDDRSLPVPTGPSAPGRSQPPAQRLGNATGRLSADFHVAGSGQAGRWRILVVGALTWPFGQLCPGDRKYVAAISLSNHRLISRYRVVTVIAAVRRRLHLRWQRAGFRPGSRCCGAAGMLQRARCI